MAGRISAKIALKLMFHQAFPWEASSKEAAFLEFKLVGVSNLVDSIALVERELP